MPRIRHTGFKRKRAGLGVRASKRRRFSRRSRRGARTAAFGNRSDTYATYGFKAKRWSRRRWKGALYNSTQQKAHYRVAATWMDTISTPVNATLCQVKIVQATDNSVNRFWTTAGGAIDVNGGTMPLFTDDLVIRGGTLSITFTYSDATVAVGDHIKIRLYLVKGAKNFNASGFNSSTLDQAWDLTMFPEFRDVIGKVVMAREFDIGGAFGTSMTFKRRIGVQKIDDSAWSNLSTGRWYWVYIANNPDNNSNATADVQISMNMSFSGDVIGTT